MRHLLLILSILICFISANAQLKVDAGNDIIVCCCSDSEEREEIMQIGGSPVASGGVEPYTYTWSSRYYGNQYPDTFPKWIFASDILEDTTQSNPVFKKGKFPDVEKSLTFYLKVEDNAGNVKYDSVRIFNSSFFIITIYKLPDTIQIGDSVQFFGNAFLESNFEPLSEFTFSPSSGLTDSTDLFTWASPDTTTTYYLQATNAAGCRSSKVEYLKVVVIDTTIQANNSVAGPGIQCYLEQGNVVINRPDKNYSSFNLTVTTLSGQIVHSGKYTENYLRLTNLGLKPNQLYIVSVAEGLQNQTFKLFNNH